MRRRYRIERDTGHLIGSIIAAVALLLICAGSVSSHDEAIRPASSGPTPWTDQAVAGPAKFQFAIVGDRTGGARLGVFQEALVKLNLMQPDFVMSVGDLIEGYHEDRELLEREWDEFEGFLDRLDMRFYLVPGNHDISNPMMAREWERRFGPAYYHFVYKDVLFLCLNTEDQEYGNISQEQIDYFADVLEEHLDVRWTFLFMHSPRWLDKPESWPPIEAILGDRPYTVYAGHHHEYWKEVRNGRKYFVLATTGGAYAQKMGKGFGDFDHVAWVTMTDEGPMMANLPLDGIWDEDIRLFENAAHVGPFRWRDAVSVKPIFVMEDEFEGGNSTLTVRNATSDTLHFTGHFDANPNFIIKPVDVAFDVQPADTAEVELQVIVHEPAPIDSLKPLAFSWEGMYDVLLHPLQDKILFTVNRPHAIDMRETPVTVDGDLSEWDQLPIALQEPAQIEGEAASWSGPDDVSYRFGVERDAENIYVGVEVLDDQVIARPNNLRGKRDWMTMHFDARAEPNRSNSRGRGSWLRLGAPPPEEASFYEEEDVAGKTARVASLRTERSYNVEISAPVSFTVEKQGPDWTAIRINAVATDVDADGSVVKIWWKPSWRGLEDIPASGTFVKR